MTHVVKIVVVGESLGIALPKPVLRHLKVGLSDELRITAVPDGIELTRINPADAEKMRALGQVRSENREVLKKLAGS
jgi:putative addiction module antidote